MSKFSGARIIIEKDGQAAYCIGIRLRLRLSIFLYFKTSFDAHGKALVDAQAGFFFGGPRLWGCGTGGDLVIICSKEQGNKMRNISERASWVGG